MAVAAGLERPIVESRPVSVCKDVDVWGSASVMPLLWTVSNTQVQKRLPPTWEDGFELHIPSLGGRLNATKESRVLLK